MKVRDNPWRAVLAEPAPLLMEGRGSVLGPDTTRRTRWWEIHLECGHFTERTVRYAPKTPDERYYARARPASAVLPPPKRVRCDECGAAARRAAREAERAR